MRRFLLLCLIISPLSLATQLDPQPLPQFTASSEQDWINSPPLTREQLRGKVVLLDVWTFDCWNCYRSFPWLHGVEEQFAEQDFHVIGIHSPEFAHERKRANVLAKVNEFKLEHPVMLDNDFAYWKALNNRYWPAFYLVDKQGKLRYRWVGETHAGSAQARNIEQAIEQLLVE